MRWCLLLLLLITAVLDCQDVLAQVAVNRAPQFLANGDMARFAISEDTIPGSAVYKLQGTDPEGSSVVYSISGEWFTVHPKTGVVTLVKSLDRETQDFIRVVISITDEGIAGSSPNTISLLREIPVLDINDNAPEFEGRPYSVKLFENAPIGSKVFSNVSVMDKDGGINGDVILTCLPTADRICSIFDITTEKISDGQYQGIVTLLKPLDFERQRSYSLTLKASDRAKDPTKRLTATANIAIDVEDVQDQPPVFLNAPYSATTPENTEAGTQIVQVAARDGDVGDPRPIRLDILDDILGYFELVPESSIAFDDGAPISAYNIITSDNPLDKEHPDIVHNGGIYTFRLRATELINGELPAEFTDTTVTIVVTDTDDQLPVFNRAEFHVNVSEQIGADSPLPGINMMVTDADTGDNARYTLALRDVKNSEDVVSLHPSEGQGHTVVVLRVNDPSKLDYDTGASAESKAIIFDIVAGVKNEYGVSREVASSRVFLYPQDANDHAPEFPTKSLHLSIPEDASPNTLVSSLMATDRDSGLFAQIRYVLKGVGTNKFYTDPTAGGIYLGSAPLDYESQRSYALALIAVDGGNRSSSISINIDVNDINDNSPKFDLKEFSRTVRTKSTSFQPEFFIIATDIDGPQQGGGRIRYEIIQKNFEGNIVDIDSETGEVLLNEEVSPAHTPKGQYELTVRAWDHGNPPLSADARVNIRVGYQGNQRPFFRGNAKHSSGIAFYNITVPENKKADQDIYQLEAVDPDGAAGQLNYFIPENGKDNFAMDLKSGMLKTSSFVDLDLELNPSLYKLKVEVVDMGFPVAETGTVEVLVHITDINNKLPVFTKDSFTFYIADDAEVNSTIATVEATDPDSNPDIQYRLHNTITYFDKAGLSVNEKDIFTVNNFGQIILTKPIPPVISHVILKVEAEDMNAVEKKQKTTAEVLIYIQSIADINPIFTDSTWTPKNKTIIIDLDEEIPKNTVIHRIKTKDPTGSDSGLALQTLNNDFPDIFSVNEDGEVTLLRRLDFENSPIKIFNISVRVVVMEEIPFDITFKSSGERVLNLEDLPQVRFADAVLQIRLQNINEFAPVFQQDLYRKRVLENVKYPAVLLKITAADFDKDPVVYSLSGESSSYFQINSSSGEITVDKNVTLDREKQNVYKVIVMATDLPPKGSARSNQAVVWFEVLDVNDNAPNFGQTSYSFVIPENVVLGRRIAGVKATDADLGLAGEVTYSFVNEGDAVGLFKINAENGEITTNKVLTGRGRADPYTLTVKASDKGDQILDADGRRSQKSLSTEVRVVVFVGDVIVNDGVPVWIRPDAGQKAEVSEDASINTPVFQVIATDPDDPNSPEGQIRYKFLRDGKQDSRPFKINEETGLITTKSSLDREKKSSYQLIIVAHDLGDVPQEATRLLQVDILDVDDHSPRYTRAVNALPLQMGVTEESANGTEVGLLQCEDEDIGVNSAIDYVISDGDSEGKFSVERTPEDAAIIRVKGRIDRETVDTHLLTIKCFKLADDGAKLNYLRPYNPNDLSERQVLIKVEDVDDNNPVFSSSNITLGVRLNVPVDTNLATLQAMDPDIDSPPLQYRIHNITFIPGTGRTAPSDSVQDIFTIDETSGELQTARSIRPYAEGFFDVTIVANNTNDVQRQGNTTARIFVLRDRSLLKFVFDKPPGEIGKLQRSAEKAVAEVVGASAIHMFDTQFLTKRDGSLDFSSTSSCFQVILNKTRSLDELERMLNASRNAALRGAYEKFSIVGVERCATHGNAREASWVQIWVLVVAAAIGVLALIASMAICCCYARYKRVMRRKRQELQKQQRIIPVPSVADYMTIRPTSSVMGSQMVLNKLGRSARGSQLTLHKGGGSMLLSQPATQIGSQLIINPKNQPMIMGSQMMGSQIIGSQMMASRNDIREDFGSQIMYEFVDDGNDNLAYDHS